MTFLKMVGCVAIVGLTLVALWGGAEDEKLAAAFTKNRVTVTPTRAPVRIDASSQSDGAATEDAEDIAP